MERTRIPAPRERVWAFLADLDARYTDWHPEHLVWRTLRGKPLEEGSVWFADEWVGRLRVQGRFFTERVEPGAFFAYRIGFPASLARAGGSFRLMDSSAAECELVEEVHLGFAVPLLGALFDLLLRLVLPLNEIRRHMREEGDNLVRLMGPGHSPAAA